MRNHHLWNTIIGMSWDLIGHEWAADFLKEHISRDQLRHAYLITGPQGVGRRTLALRFAQALNCTQPRAPGVPCLQCLSCRQIGRMQYSDLAVVQSEKSAYLYDQKNNPGEHFQYQPSGGKRKRKPKEDEPLKLSREILIDQIRDLQRTMALSPYQSSYRIALILEVENANENTANSMLKTLEEPSSRSILLLTADNAERLAPTLVSRCEIIRLRPVPIRELELVLINNYNLSEDQARLFAHLSGGRPGTALHLSKDKEFIQKRTAWLDDHSRLLSVSRVERFEFASSLASAPREQNLPFELVRDQIKQPLITWISLWRDVYLDASGATVPLTNIDRLEEIAKMSSRFGLRAALDAIRSIERVLYLLERNVNPRLATEVLMLDLPRW